jgi:CSLREA domain-containing protein
VNTTDDTAGNGCDGIGTCSLRQALSSAHSDANINFAPGLTGTIVLTSALPSIGDNTTIQGPGANALTISGAGSYQVFNIFPRVLNASIAVAISGLTIANGSAAASAHGGGAISNYQNSTLSINGCTFSHNSNPNGTLGGGAIYNAGTLVVTNSTFTGNTDYGSSGGGAVYSTNVPGPQGMAIVTNSTFAGNSARNQGGAVLSFISPLTVTNSIFSGNSAPLAPAIYGNATLGDTAPVTESHNLFYNNTGDPGGDTTFTHSTTDISGHDPMLLSLDDYGGATQTMLPQPGSPAICAGTATPANATLPTTDQRGFPVNTSCVDIGAVQTNYLIVNTTADSTDGSCGTTCSLRDAIIQANANTAGDIAFSNGVTGMIRLGGSPLPITGQLLLLGPGVNNLTISGGTVLQIFNIGTGANAAIRGLTLVNGYATAANGGAIANYGTLALTTCNFILNTADGSGGAIANYGTLTAINTYFQGNQAGKDGGAIFNSSQLNGQDLATPPTATITNSTFYQNSAVFAGGAILNLPTSSILIGAPTSLLTVTNSTFYGNGSVTEGGAIDNYATLKVANSTFTGNGSNGYGGGINQAPEVTGGYGTTMTVTNSIFSANSAIKGGGGIAEEGGSFSEQYNLYYSNTGSDSYGFTPATTDITGQDPMLAPISNYGGPTPTMLPLPGPQSGSAAICAGSASLIAGTANDQRGFPRTTTYTVNGNPTTCVDIGAVQTNYSVQFANVPSSGYSALAGALVTPAPVVSVTENGQNMGGIPITLTFSGAGIASGLGPVTTVAGTGATFGGISVNLGGIDTLSAALYLNPATATPSLTISSVNAGLTVDTVQPPSVISVSSTSNVSYGIGAVVPITVTFTSPVIVTGTPQLALLIQSLPICCVPTVAIYSSGSGTSTLTFKYTVVALGEQFGLLGSSTLTLNGGTITDVLGDPAILTLPSGALLANDIIIFSLEQVNNSSVAVTETGVLYTPYGSSHISAPGGRGDPGTTVWDGGAGTTAFTVTNTSASTIPGPVTLALDSGSPVGGSWIASFVSLAPGASGGVLTPLSLAPGTVFSVNWSVFSGSQQ